MMKKGLVFLVLVGCAAGGGQPMAARLAGADLVVTMPNGTTCRAAWAEGEGRMEDCAADWRVIAEAHPNFLHQALQDVTAQAGASAIFPAMAAIEVTGPDRISRRFTSPPPMEE